MAFSRDTNLTAITVEPDLAKADATVIWLHGLGADGNDFAGIVTQLGLPASHSIRFIFPHAPYRKITINGGMAMRAWYDLYDMQLTSKEDEPGIKQSQQLLLELVSQEVASGISSERIILAGFSQGGAIALYTGLRANKKLGGIIALSTYQVLADTLVTERSAVNAKLAIFMAHGSFDNVVPLAIGQETCQQLQALDYLVKWQVYPMQHSVVTEEVQHISNFINEVLLGN